MVTAPVFRDLEQILHTVEARFARQIVSDIREPNRHDRIHDNLPLVHPVTTARLDVGPHPNADSTFDPPASNSFAKTFSEYHEERDLLVPGTEGHRIRTLPEIRQSRFARHHPRDSPLAAHERV